MPLDAVATPEDEGLDAVKRERPTRRRRLRLRAPSTPPWLLRVTVESFLVVLSILAALAVENWRENRDNQRLALQSLQIFEREIRQNLARLDDVAPYHAGLRTVVAQSRSDPAHGVDIRSVVEGLRPTVLLNTAWQTSLATGALTHIDVETVSALSLTYSIQQRFVEDTRASFPRISLSDAPEAEQLRRTIQDTYSYLNGLVGGEQELRGVYKQALQIIGRKLQENSTQGSRADTART